jgi:hypothetical protein
MTTAVPKGGGAPFSFGPGVPERIEQLVNAFSRWVGYRPVAVDGQIDAVDAGNVVAIQHWLFDRAKKPEAIRALHHELGECATVAELSLGRDGIERTAEQVWVARHQQAVITKLPAVFRQLAKGGG